MLVAPTKAGNITLRPGQYRVSVDGSDAVFQDVRNSHQFRIAAKVEDNGETFEQTRVRTSKHSGRRHVEAIEMEGSTTRIEFLQN